VARDSARLVYEDEFPVSQVPDRFASLENGNYIARIEIGSKTPTLATLHRISVALGTEVGALLAPEATAPPTASEVIEFTLRDLNESESDFVIQQLRDTCEFIRRHRNSG
jgi:transcriptional regulator with XRE-family HTH domain